MVTKDTGIIEAVKTILKSWRFSLNMVWAASAAWLLISKPSVRAQALTALMLMLLSKISIRLLPKQKQTNKIAKRDKYCTGIFLPHRKNEGTISSTSGDGSLFS